MVVRTVKLLEENLGCKLFDIVLGNDFFGFDSKSQGNDSKNKQGGLHKNKKLLHNEGNHQQNEKATYGMRENICKPHIQTMQATHTTQ